MSEADGAPDVTDTVDMSEEAAAVKIQAMQRGKQARREHEELLRVKAAFEKFDTDGSGSLEIAELYDVLKEVGVDIDTDTFADYQLALMEDYDADDSGALDFREFRKFHEQVLANESTRKAYARELDAAVKGLVSSALSNVIERQEMEGAALKIQAVHRGKQARKELQERREMEAAAVKIQAVHRGKQARAQLEQEKAELNAAALKIQAVHRGKQTRQSVDKTRRVKAAFDAFDADGSGELEVDELREVMAHLGLELTKGEFDHYVAALMEDYDVDDSGSLDFWEFEKFYEQCLASDDLRAAYASELDAAVKGVVSGALGNVIERRQKEDEEEMEGAALKIQAVHRGKRARKQLQERREMEAAAVKIQAVHRGKKAREAYEQEKAELSAAALKIQAVHRGKLARKQIAKAKWSEEEARKARLAFWKFDTDQSGKLEVNELRGVLSSLGLEVPEENFEAYATEIMAEFDTDNDGTLDYEEFEKFWLGCLASEELKAQYAAKVERACGKIVAGALANLYAREQEESAAAVKIQAVQRGKKARKEQEELFRVHAAFKKFDTDKSGSLEIPELYDVLKEIGVDLDRDTFDEYADALMEDYDEDDSGTLDFREFHKFYNQVLANENTKAEYAKELESAVSGLVSGAISNLYKREEEEEMNAAALKIQAVHRGKKVRKDLQEQKEMEAAALKIQAVHRGKQTRQSVDKTRRVKAAFDAFDADGSGELEVDELREVMAHLGLELTKGEFDHYVAALMEDYDVDNSGSLDFWEFEKFYEQCLASDDLRAAYASELDAAVKGVVSGALGNILEQHEMENAAMKIQAVHRGKQARKQLQERKEMEAAAVKIQAVHRGKMARKSLVQPPPRASEAPPTPKPAAMSEEEELSAAAVKIQAVQRGKKARKEQEELFRVHAAFKKFDTDKSGSLEIPELYNVLKEIGVDLDRDTFDEYADALMEDYDEDDSGTLDFREFHKFYNQVLANENTKAEYAKELESAVSGLVSGAINNLFEQAERQEQEAAALKIQAMHRGKKAREQLRKDRDEEEAAALKIQAMHRGRKTRQELSRQKEADAEEQELTAAALKIQAVHRGRKTRMELLKQKQEEEEELTAAALKIQAVHRGRKTRMELLKQKQEEEEELTAAALKIQAVHRGRKTRMELLKEKQEKEELTAAALKIQAVHRGRKTRMELLKEKQEKDEMEAAALKIQAVHRGKKTRMELLKEKQEKEELTAAALKIQAVHRGRKTRMELLKEKQEKDEMEAAALKIQAVHRGKKTRMELLRERREREEMEAAAVKIQAVHRGKSARADLLKEKQEREELTAAATKIQAVHRGRVVRKNVVVPEPVEVRLERTAVTTAANLHREAPALADALQAAAHARRVRPSKDTPSGLSKLMVRDLARRLPGLASSGRSGDPAAGSMQALKLIAAVVAAARGKKKSGKVHPATM